MAGASAPGVRPDAVAADFHSLEEAADWFAVLQADEVSEASRAEWQNWLAARPQNASAWRHIETVSRRFTPLRGEGETATTALESARSGVAARRRALRGGALVLLCSMLGALGWRQQPVRELVARAGASHRSGVGERRELRLDDGGMLWLNTDSAVDVAYSPALRRVSLLAGEILIQTATDTLHRPFVVDTPQGRLEALGTRFTVRRLAEGRSYVAVYQGAVRITAAGGEALVPAGFQAVFSESAIEPLQPADPAREAWVKGVLLADDLPLAELVAELSRYQRGHLGVAPEVAGLRVMGVYPADAEQALAMLERSLPVKLKRSLPWWATVVPR